jgi:hypothetical protein
MGRTDPLLGKDQKKENQYSRCYATVEVLLDYRNGNGVLYVVRAEML